MAKIEHIKNKRGEVIYPVSKEGAIYDENGVLLSTKIATFITRLVDNLANYYLKSETYTKAEVDELIGAIQGFTYIVVSELPTASAETMGIVYLVPSEDPQTQNVKDEYITIRSGVEGSYTYSWEQIGSTAIDLSGYVTTEALNTALADYTTTANLTTLLAGKQDTISDLNTIRSGAAAGATAYQKPGAGIPATDMASGVQTSLGKADSAYQKPSGGIPKTDLESGVQESLELADSAVQADPIGSIVPPVDPSEFATKEEVEGLEAELVPIFYSFSASSAVYAGTKVFKYRVKNGETYSFKVTSSDISTVNAFYICDADGSNRTNLKSNFAVGTEQVFTANRDIDYFTIYISPVSGTINVGIEFNRSGSISSKIKDLQAEDVELNARIDGVSSGIGAVSDKLDGGYELVGRNSDYQSLETGYIQYSDGERNNSSSAWSILTFKVNDYQKVIAKDLVSNSSGTVAAIAFYSGNPSSSTYIQASSKEAELGTFDYSADIPSNAKYVKVCYRGGDCQVYFYRNEALFKLLHGEDIPQNIVSAPRMVYTAHRGIHLNGIAPENSIDSVRLTARAGFDLCEFDVKKTADGEFVVSHSSDLKVECRNASDYSVISSSVYIEDLTLAEIRSGYVLASVNPQMRRPVPTFAEMLSACKAYGITPYVDCKISTNYDVTDAPKLLALVREYYGNDRIYWGSSYNGQMRGLSQRINVGRLGSEVPEATQSVIDGCLALANSDGENVHTSYDGKLTGNPYFTRENVAKFLDENILFGVYCTGIQPNLDELIKRGVCFVAADNVAPNPGGRNCCFLASSKDGDYSDFRTDEGTVSDKIFNLPNAKKMELKYAPSVQYLSGVYISFELKGSVTMECTGHTADGTGVGSHSLSGDSDYSSFHFSYLACGVAPSFKLTATSNSKIRNISFAVIPF